MEINFDRRNVIGIGLLKTGAPIKGSELKRIFGLFTNKDLQNLGKFNYQMKIRAIAIIVFELVSGKKISPFEKGNDLDN